MVPRGVSAVLPFGWGSLKCPPVWKCPLSHKRCPSQLSSQVPCRIASSCSASMIPVRSRVIWGFYLVLESFLLVASGEPEKDGLSPRTPHLKNHEPDFPPCAGSPVKIFKFQHVWIYSGVNNPNVGPNISIFGLEAIFSFSGLIFITWFLLVIGIKPLVIFSSFFLLLFLWHSFLFCRFCLISVLHMPQRKL